MSSSMPTSIAQQVVPTRGNREGDGPGPLTPHVGAMIALASGSRDTIRAAGPDSVHFSEMLS